MPTLHWIGKDAVVNHHETVPVRLLRPEPELSVGSPDTGNLLVEGDNLLALKALLPYYAGQVKCIYIDPPYNTGNEGWIYNDAVNAPEIRKWLEGTLESRKIKADDLSGHDKWLCMMYPRLQLLHQFLCNDGLIFVQIGDEEAAHVKCLLDEVFGIQNFRNAIVVRRGTKNVQSQFSSIDSLSVGKDTIFMYSRTTDFRLPKLQQELDESEAGKWDTFWRGTDRPTMRYEIFGIEPQKGQWRWSQDRANKAKANYETFCSNYQSRMALDEYYFHVLTTTGNKVDFIRLGPDGAVQYYVAPRSYKLMSDVWMDVPTRGTVTDFPHEKHTELLKRIFRWTTAQNDLVMDSFAGSGATGHAVIQLNREDGGNRRFLLVEMEPNIARNVTTERLRRIICGLPAPTIPIDTDSMPEPAAPAPMFGPDDESDTLPELPQATLGLGGGFSFLTLGDQFFTDDGELASAVTFSDLARYLFYTETNQPLSDNAAPAPPLLGIAGDTAIYLLWNGCDSLPLDAAALRDLPAHDGAKIIYAAACLLSDARLEAERIHFRQFPYNVKLS